MPEPRTRTLLVMLTVPADWADLSPDALRRKLDHPLNAGPMLDFIAREVHRCIRDPDTSADLIAARILAEQKAADR